MNTLHNTGVVEARRRFLSRSLGGLAAVALSGLGGRALAQAGSPAPAYRERLVPRAGAHLYVRDYPGAGPAFVLMHGFPDNLHIYDGLAPLLAAAGRRVVAFDFLGFGASDKPPGMAYSFEQQLGDLGAVVEALQLETIVPVAHDASGPAAINYALDHPARVSAIVLLNTFYQESTTTHFPELITLFSESQLHALSTGFFLSDPARMEQLLMFQNHQFNLHSTPAQKEVYDRVLQPIVDRNFAGGAGPAFLQMTADLRRGVAYDESRVPLMAGFPGPVVAIFGTQDPYLDGAVGREFTKRFQHCSFEGLPAGHWVQIDMPEAVAKSMLARA